MRKFLGILLAVVLCLSSVSALAAYNDHTDYSQFPLVKDGESMTITVAHRRSEKYGKDPEDTWFWVWSEQVTGIDFEVDQILTSAAEERKSLMFASGDLPDLIMGGVTLTTSELVRYGMGDGLLLDLTPYITPEIMPNLCKWVEEYPIGLAYCTTPDGKIYSLPGYQDIYVNADASPAMMINEVWAEEAGLDANPLTLDKFTELLYKFKELHPDGYVLAGGEKHADPREFLKNAFGYLITTTTSTVDPALRNGEVVIPAYDDTYVEYLKLMHQYYVDGIISPEFFTIEQTTNFAKLAEDSVGAYSGNVYLGIPEYEDYSKWVRITPLTSEYNDTPMSYIPNKYKYGGCMLSADVAPEKIEVILRYLDFFYSDLGGMYLWCGPAAGSADLIGMMGGYKTDDNGAAIWYDADGNQVDSQAVMEGDCGGLASCFGNRSHPLNKELFDQGVTNRPEMRTYYYSNGENIVPYTYDPMFGHGYTAISVEANVLPYATNGYPFVTYYDEDTTLEITDLVTLLDPYVQAEEAKFITGVRDLSEFPKFQEELKNMGIETLLGYYTETYASYLESMN